MKKKLFALVLMLCMVLSVLPLQSNAVATAIAESGGWIVGVEDTGTMAYYIIGYKGSGANVTVPTLVAGYTIAGIHNLAFMGNTTMKTLNVPEGMTVYGLGGCDVETVNLGKDVKLATGAFANCKKLKKVNFPDTLTSIPAKVFENCTGLTSIIIPSQMKTIGASAFEGCTGLTSVTIPEGVQTISQEAFQNCASLTSVTLPDSITFLGIYAFSGCSALKSINIPAALTEIDLYAFQDCGSLESIPVASKNPTYYNDADGNLCTYNVHVKCEELVRGVSAKYGSSYTLPSTAGIIGRTAFSGSTGLKSLVIPKNIRSLDHRSFANCTSLTEIRFEGQAPSVDFAAFLNVTANIYYPGDLGTDGGWPYFSFNEKDGNLTWIPYCSGIHTGTPGTVIQESSCNKAGSAEAVCDLCGKDFIASLPLADHTYDEGVITKPSTCSIMGVKTYSCIVCNHKTTEDLPFAEHTFDYDNMTEIQKSSCYNPGIYKCVCTVCNTQTEVLTPELEHIFEGNVCTLCGYGIHRLFGPTRYETAYMAAEKMKSYPQAKLNSVVLAYGKNYADALSGSFLAGRRRCPIILVDSNNLDEVKQFVINNVAQRHTIYLLGGHAVIPESLENELKEYFQVVRLGGKDRYETNLAALDWFGRYENIMIVCTGANFADALSAASLNQPILLVKNRLTQSQLDFLKSTSVDREFIILGGTSAVSTTVEKQLSEFGSVKRIAGATRYETSALVAQEFYKTAPGVVLAYGENFPDGLSGGALAAYTYSPLLLVAPGKESYAADYVTSHKIRAGYVMGGPGLISNESMHRVFGLDN